MAGLTADGLSILRQPEVLAEIVASEQENIDPNIDTRDDELLGQLNNIMASRMADLWALTQSVNDNFNPLTAEGKNLDDLAALNGLARIAATFSSTSSQRFVGNNGTTIPAGTIIQNPASLKNFNTITNININLTACISAQFTVNNLQNSTPYTLDVDGTTYTFTTDADATALEVLNGLEALITADTAATWSATVNATDLYLEVVTDDTANVLNINSTTFLSSQAVTVLGFARAETTGATSAPSNTVILIITAVSGLDSTTNDADYEIGRARETDEELRLRILSSQQSAGTATVEAILDSLTNLAGVSTAIVTENDTSVTDADSRPPKSFEAVVQGGVDADIAQTLWETKPAGIATYGSTPIVIQDSLGRDQTINFTRPAVINLAVQVEYTKYDEETFPVTGEAAMSTVVKEYTDALGLGVDVIPSRYFGSLYSNVEGINSLIVSIQVLAASGDAPDGGSWQTTKLDINIDELAGIESVDITIIEV